MATGGTAPPITMANPSHSLLDPDSTVSSPLSEMGDVDMNSPHSDDDDELVKPERGRAGGPANHTSHDDSDSNLSDIETNDSEAETLKLHNTPRKSNIGQSNITASSMEVEQNSPSEKASRTFQRSPSKLQEQIRADLEAESGDEDGDLSEDADDEDKGSAVYSDAESDKEDEKIPKKPSRNKSHDSHIVASSTAIGSSNDSSESRKRKRSSLPDHDASEQARKRAGSAAEPGDETSSLSKIMSEDLAPTNSTGDKSAEHSGLEDNDDVAMKEAEDVAESVEKPTHEPSRPKKSKRASTKKRKGSEEEATEEGQEPENLATEEGQAVEDEPVETAEVFDEEAHKEEELERKRNAFDQLSSIEKHFAVLRDRLYEERLAQLTEEEAMLTSENPTHPEYLAMMQCIDSRRDDRLRVIELEYKFNMDALDRWAVARRSQILSQFYQSVRESREKTLDELGKQWYEIQHERRKNANPIPDFGYRFPKTKALQKRQAIAHSKETSILAGIAQHHGFPAAPEMKGASQTEVDEDFEAMHRARQSIMGPAQHAQPALNEYGAVPFGRNLGPAGEQFLEQTPWANPRHPSHHVGSRRHSQGAYAGPPGFSTQPRTAQPQGGGAWFANGQSNGDAVHRPSSAVADQETGHARKAGETAKSKREAVVL